MIGTDPAGKGGVASVVSVLIAEGFLRDRGIRYVSSHTGGDRGAKLAAAIRCFLLVLRILILEHPDVVHVHAASRASFFRKSLFLAMARLFGRRTIFHLHGAEFRQFATLESGPIVRWWIRHTLRRTSCIVALSASWAAFLQDFAPGARVCVVPNSVRLRHPPDRTVEEAGRILFLGRADRRKGIFELLEAVAMVKDVIPNIRLAIGGDGDLQLVQARAAALGLESVIEILGWIGAEQREAELARAALFTLPSHDEGLPMAMLEAMSAGKAIVVTPVGGIPETVVSGDNGLLVAPGDVAALAAALRDLLINAKLRQHLGDRARETIAAAYSTDVVMSRLSALYEELGGVAG